MRRNAEAGQITTYLKSTGDYEAVLDLFNGVEKASSVLEKIEINADTYKIFRRLGELVEQTSIRDCRKGLFGRLWTAEVWINNKLKEGQAKITFSKFEDGSDREDAEVPAMGVHS